jgi:hypothetical protein
MKSATEFVWGGVFVGLGIAAVAMAAYCVVLALPLAPSQGSQVLDENTERVGNVILFGVLYFALVCGPTAAAFGGAIGVITYIIRRKKESSSDAVHSSEIQKESREQTVSIYPRP